MDYFGEYEPSNTVYTLTAYVSPRLPPRWFTDFFIREGNYDSEIPDKTRQAYMTPGPKPTTPLFGKSDLPSMKKTTIKIKSEHFPSDIRCEHVKKGRECTQGCYLHDRGGKQSFWRCKRTDCEGHMYSHKYSRDYKESQFGTCFGKKGERLVALRSE